MGEVVRFPKFAAVHPGEGAANKLVRHAALVSDFMGDDLDGFFVIGVDKNGKYSCGWDAPPDMGISLFAAMVMEAVRRETIIQTEVVDVLNRGDDTADDDGA